MIECHGGILPNAVKEFAVAATSASSVFFGVRRVGSGDTSKAGQMISRLDWIASSTAAFDAL